MTRTTIERSAAVAVIGALVLVAAAVAWYGRAAVPGAGDPAKVVVNLTGVASSGVWTDQEVNGLNYWWKTFEPATIHLRLGDEVVLNLRSADLFHCFYAPAFGVGPVDVEPGHQRTVRFRADRVGVFQYYCTSMCGSCHFFMRGWIVVTAPGERPIQPPPIVCQRCLPDSGVATQAEVVLDATTPAGLVEHGAWLYLQKGCVTCHGPEGRGGVPNPNSTIHEPPAHDTTAQKLFLASEEDAAAFLALLAAAPDLPDPAEMEGLGDVPEIARLPVVRTRYLNAKEIVRTGRYTAKLDPAGPEPPLQMPAWQFLLGEREIDSLLAYFISLYDWEEV